MDYKKRESETKRIMQRFKPFFKVEKGIRRTLMGFGFECDMGWFPILEKLFEDIQKLNPPEEFEIIQVKEKFGGLRVYANYSSDEIEKLIDEACEKASKTCEVCGKEAVLCTNKGWLKTVCPECIASGDEMLQRYKPCKDEEDEDGTDSKEEK